MPTVTSRVLCSVRGAAGQSGSRASIDWCNGLIAYASQRSVVLVAERTMETVQTLDDHATGVTAVRFARSSVMRPTVAQADLLLATGDQSGTILLWHVGFAFAHTIKHTEAQPRTSASK